MLYSLLRLEVGICLILRVRREGEEGRREEERPRIQKPVVHISNNLNDIVSPTSLISLFRHPSLHNRIPQDILPFLPESIPTPSCIVDDYVRKRAKPER